MMTTGVLTIALGGLDSKLLKITSDGIWQQSVLKYILIKD